MKSGVVEVESDLLSKLHAIDRYDKGDTENLQVYYKRKLEEFENWGEQVEVYLRLKLRELKKR